MVTKAFRSGLSAISKYEINWGDWLAPALILVIPFVNFLDYHAYGLLQPESLFAIGILAGVGLAVGLLTALRWHLSLPLVPWSLPLQPAYHALALVFFVDFQPDLKKPVINLISIIFSDGTRCVPCIGSYFIVVFLLVFAVAYTLKKNAGKVFATIFSVILVATLLLPQAAEDRRVITRSESVLPATEVKRHDLPPIVHIIVDEHTGIEGVPEGLPGGTALRSDLLDFYAGNGFRVYGAAFSQYVDSGNSISNLVNGAARSRGQLFITPSGPGYIVAENAWFDRLSAQGYRIHVYQSDYLDFCAGEGHRIGSCTSYPASGIAVLRNLDVAMTTKVGLLFDYFSQPSSFYGLANRLPSYLRSFRRNTERPFESASDRWQPAALSAPWAMMIAERLIDDLREAESGTAYFAHLLLPHRGFVMDESCRLKADPASWYDHPRLGLRRGQRLAGQSRRARYIEYFKQVRCARRTMGRVMEALGQAGVLDEAIVIVHGDHGSRIAGLPPRETYASGLTRTDLTDNFSALFAIRSPGLKAGYDSSVRSVQALFADLAYGRPIDDERAVVFLSPTLGGPSAPLVEYPFPGFE